MGPTINKQMITLFSREFPGFPFIAIYPESYIQIKRLVIRSNYIINQHFCIGIISPYESFRHLRGQMLCRLLKPP